MNKTQYEATSPMLKTITEKMESQDQQAPPTKSIQKRIRLPKDIIKKFKQHLMNKDFFASLKLIMYGVDKEMQMTRNGASVSDNYIKIRKDSGKHCTDATRFMVTHNPEFR